MKNSLSSSQFKHVFSDSSSLKAGSLFFKYKNSSLPAIGMVVSKKYGNSVLRNLLKRRCRAEFQNLIKLGFNCSLVVFPNKKNLSWQEIRSSFNFLKKTLND